MRAGEWTNHLAQQVPESREPSGGLREWALKHESVWLIEDPQNHPQQYWLPNLRMGTDWTYDVHQAVRFARHNDANAVIAARPNIDELWIAVQHAWDDPELDAALADTKETT
jgi:hypothetical protein